MCTPHGHIDGHMSTCCTPRVHIDELDGVNAARQSVEAQLEAVPSVAQQVVTMTRLVEALDSLWDRPAREVASLLQAVGVRAWCARTAKWCARRLLDRTG